MKTNTQVYVVAESIINSLRCPIVILTVDEDQKPTLKGNTNLKHEQSYKKKSKKLKRKFIKKNYSSVHKKQQKIFHKISWKISTENIFCEQKSSQNTLDIKQWHRQQILCKQHTYSFQERDAFETLLYDYPSPIKNLPKDYYEKSSKNNCQNSLFGNSNDGQQWSGDRKEFSYNNYNNYLQIFENSQN